LLNVVIEVYRGGRISATACCHAKVGASPDRENASKLLLVDRPGRYSPSVTSRSSRGRWERVVGARRQARLALGKDPEAPDDYSGQPRPRSSPPPPPAPRVIEVGPGVRVLMVGEAAIRLRMSRTELEAMIARGAVETLPIEFGCVVPTREVERLKQLRT
jgi:hypothetical protein